MVVFRHIVYLSLISVSAWSQTNRYVISFRDKNNTPYSISQPQEFLSSRAIQRRSRIAFQVTPDDLPVTPSYVTGLSATGAKVFFTSRWMNAALVEASPAIVDLINGLPFVTKSELVAPGKKLSGGRSKQRKQRQVTSAAEVTAPQLQMLGIDKMQADGFNGDGIIVSVLDAGFPGVNTTAPFQTIFTEGRIQFTQDYITNSGNVYQFDAHGTEVFSVIAAQLQGIYTGGLSKASYLLFVTEDVTSEYRVEEYNWLLAAEKADSAGTDLIHASLGYNLFDDSQMDYRISELDGKTAVISRAAGMARDRGIIVVVSAGNEGTNAWHYITPPADVDGILATGAVNASKVKVAFSSFGPSSDGRIKPDVAALGQSVTVIQPNGTTGMSSGTSLAAPLVTSLAAGLLQAYPNLTPAEIVSAIKLSASQAGAPDNQLGFGIPNYTAVKNYIGASRLSEEVVVFPNPANATLHLAFKQLPGDQVELTFHDALGKPLSNPAVSVDWLNNPIEISISNLAAGIYFLHVRTAEYRKSFRFVKF